MSSVSVIIPCYNSAAWIAEAVESCISQGALLREVILIDDHSEDQTLKKAEELKAKFPSLVKVFINPLKGGNRARNHGFEKSTGDFIQWLDADDILLPGKFEAQVAALNNAMADIAYSDWELITCSEKGNILKHESKVQCSYSDFLYEILSDNWSAVHSYLIRRSVAEKLFTMNAWNPVTEVGQDKEYITLAAITGTKFVYVPGTFAVYKRRPVKSVSKAGFILRQKQLIEMYSRFHHIIETQEWISNKNKMRYDHLLNTFKLYSSSFIENASYTGSSGLHEIHWKLVSGGFRTRFRMVLRYLNSKLIVNR